jgi:predicted RNA-binding protein with PIN domain
MALHILIDGYNLIKSDAVAGLQDIPDLQLQREALIERMKGYKRLKRHPITVVFDGTHAPGLLHRKVRTGGIDIWFSPPGQTADGLIKTMVSRQRERALVVTDDREIVQFARLKGSAVVSCLEFGQKIVQAGMMDDRVSDSEETGDPGWNPTTRKKGPSRRLSKKARKAHLKIKKL